ncbi:mechanosensitive ion channel family protein [Metasolibacillus meyeri]|uniref:mechanosensitive ion channel family protein n=1 Tax=Metasolibacillus meyeri TaxID=1071052 RepID=UPI000D32448D|nr:mechanosensitive ion channel family protein [Metasolibacillus meyeri]
MIESFQQFFTDLQDVTWQSIGTAIALLLAGLVVQQYIMKPLINWLGRFLEKRGKAFEARISTQFSSAIRYAFLTCIIFISISIVLDKWLITNPKTANLFWSFMLFFIFKGFADVITYYIDHPQSIHTQQKQQHVLMPFFLRIGKVTIYVAALFAIASLWDFNINGFLTGIGLTGVAIAFGIRDTLGHFFGGMSVALDKPFQIGDWVATEDQKIEGIVEDVNLRSTVIQTGDKGLVYIPNAYLANRPLYNLSKREKRKCEFYLYVATSNSEAILREVCEHLQGQIYLHKETEKDIIHVYIDELRPTSYRILVRFFVATNDGGQMQAVKQDMLFATKHIFEQAGIVYAADEIWVQM